MSNGFIYLPYKDEQGNVNLEELAYTKYKFGYIIKNIPFFIRDVGLADHYVLHFNGQLQPWPSGNSTIQMVLEKSEDISFAKQKLKKFGCICETWGENVISASFSQFISYVGIKSWLREGFENGKWEYTEAHLNYRHCFQVDNVVQNEHKKNLPIIFFDESELKRPRILDQIQEEINKFVKTVVSSQSTEWAITPAEVLKARTIISHKRQIFHLLKWYF